MAPLGVRATEMATRRHSTDGSGERRQSWGGNGGGTSMALVTGDGSKEGDAMGCGRFRRVRMGGGEAASV
jgi:hypothetical protein